MAWIREAPSLGGEGVEHYDGFLRSFDAGDVDPVVGALAETGQPTSLVCFSPDFTHPDADERARQVQRQRAAIDPTPRLGGRQLLHAQRAAPSGDDAGRGLRGTPIWLGLSIGYAEQRGVVLCMENHYKDGTWRYPEFAQPEDIFLEIERIDLPAFGVQHDPVERHGRRLRPGRVPRQGEAPRGLDARVRSLPRAGRHDRGSARVGGRRRAFRPSCCIGETGCGSPTTTPSSASWPVGSAGWISIEDGVNGLDEMARSVAFLEAEARRLLRRLTRR